MSNLGKYQDIVTEAKRAGGVDALIKIIEDNAVARRSPSMLAIGAGTGVLLTCFVGGGVVAARRILDKKSRQEAMAKQAKEELKAVIDRSVSTDAVNRDVDRADENPEAGSASA